VLYQSIALQFAHHKSRPICAPCAAIARLGDVVELTTFHIDLRGGSAEFGKVKDEFFPSHYPSWTAVGVAQLAMAELLVEIRAVAVVDSALS
jgi:enamine deaminase RidA (YjgF/YER057c/UK114 family)